MRQPTTLAIALALATVLAVPATAQDGASPPYNLSIGCTTVDVFPGDLGLGFSGGDAVVAVDTEDRTTVADRVGGSVSFLGTGTGFRLDGLAPGTDHQITVRPPGNVDPVLLDVTTNTDCPEAPEVNTAVQSSTQGVLDFTLPEDNMGFQVRSFGTARHPNPSSVLIARSDGTGEARDAGAFVDLEPGAVNVFEVALYNRNGDSLSTRVQLSAPAGDWFSAYDDVPSEIVVDRIAGEDRFETAALLGRRTNFSLRGPTSTEHIVIASGRNFPDALGSANLHATPLILTDTHVLPVATRDFLRDTTTLLKSVIILGGPSVVSAAVEQAVRQEVAHTGAEITRIAGDDRYDTAAQVLAVAQTRDRTVPSQRVYLVSGESFPDALSVTPFTLAGDQPRGVLVMTQRDVLPAASATALRALQEPNGSPIELVVVGGAQAISDEVVAAVRATVEVESVGRVAGDDRFATSALLARTTLQPGSSAHDLAIARGDDFADALAAGRGASALLLSPRDALPGPVKDIVADLGCAIVSPTVAGGELAISQAIVDGLQDCDRDAAAAWFASRAKTRLTITLLNLSGVWPVLGTSSLSGPDIDVSGYETLVDALGGVGRVSASDVDQASFVTVAGPAAVLTGVTDDGNGRDEDGRFEIYFDWDRDDRCSEGEIRYSWDDVASDLEEIFGGDIFGSHTLSGDVEIC